ncbi:hypothetical protein [Streptomyces sp. NPDC002602]|uniref:hypothetical protein n=1 Tax=Streptomyces sp. NPDC002602 TaxID=3364654 RepID=UPI003695B67C
MAEPRRELSAAARAAMAKGIPAATARGYAGHWQCFEQWAVGVQFDRAHQFVVQPLLAGPVLPKGSMGAMFFAVLAVAGQIERNYIREKTLEGQVIAASKGNHGGRPKVIDDDMLTFAVALKDKGVPVPEIAKKLTIKVGKNAGKSSSVASLYRALAEAEEAAADDGLPLRPKPVRIRRPEDSLTPEEIDLRERLQAQPHPNAELR